MAKNKLPEGYKGVDKLIEEFRKDNPKGKIETAPVLLGDGYVIITAKVIKDDGAVGSGMADADVQDDKSVEKAESGAIRRALLTLGYKSVEGDGGDDSSDDKDEKPEKEERRSFSRDRDEKRDSRDDEKEKKSDEKEDRPARSRFGNKDSDRSEKSRDDRKDDKEEKDEAQEEGESRFKRGSRFQRN